MLKKVDFSQNFWDRAPEGAESSRYNHYFKYFPRAPSDRRPARFPSLSAKKFPL
jgi:hypothetical protein